VQLSERSEEFTSKGVEIVTVTYDARDTAKKFHEQRNLTFPLLEDVDSDLIRRLGILNTNIEQGSRFYGIPYPGIFLVDTEGVIRAKFAEKDYRERPELDIILEAVNQL
jgi:peroxiredoxin